MKALLDECLPRRFKLSLANHECRTVPEIGLAGKKNGELLNLAEAAGFEVFLTATGESSTNRILKGALSQSF
jgi:hypothetical protein